MKNFVKATMIGLVVLMFSALGPVPVNALTYNLDNVFSGTTPSGSAPWATAAFAVTGSNQVTLTLTGNLGTQFITEWDFNFNPSLTISSLSAQMTNCTACTIVGPPPPAQVPVNISTDAYKADGDGWYDIKINFDPASPSANRFDGTDTATIVFNYSGSGFDENSFNFFSTPASGGGSGPFHTAAHVQGLPNGCSGWISDSSTTGNLGGPDNICGGGGGGREVPEPSALLLLGAGLVALSCVARRFNRRAN